MQANDASKRNLKRLDETMTIAINITSESRQELHSTAASAQQSANRWNAIGFTATVQWCNQFDDQLAIVIVTE
jgi:hypothetical protein